MPGAYQHLTPQMQEVAASIVETNMPEELAGFHFKIKAEELICLFLLEFLKRRYVQGYPLIPRM